MKTKGSRTSTMLCIVNDTHMPDSIADMAACGLPWARPCNESGHIVAIGNDNNATHVRYPSGEIVPLNRVRAKRHVIINPANAIDIAQCQRAVQNDACWFARRPADVRHVIGGVYAALLQSPAIHMFGLCAVACDRQPDYVVRVVAESHADTMLEMEATDMVIELKATDMKGTEAQDFVDCLLPKIDGLMASVEQHGRTWQSIHIRNIEVNGCCSSIVYMLLATPSAYATDLLGYRIPDKLVAYAANECFGVGAS